MNSFVIGIVSGWIFWPGLLLLLTGAGLSWRAKNWRSRIAVGLTVLGLLLVLVSALPVPGGLLIMLFLTVAAFAIKPIRRWAGILLVLQTLLAGSLELPYWLDRKPLPAPGRVWVMGDSISAGIGFKGEVTWSDLLNREYPNRVINRSTGGGTASSALSSFEKYDLRGGDVIVIEIGGNDLLGSSRNFREDLNRLLAAVAASGAPAVMFELPLPPFANGFGRAQRELAKQYGVTLIPRRYFSAVLRGEESTVDGLHLSNFGHEKMRAAVERYITMEPIQ